MSNITALRPSDVTPELLIDMMREDIKKMDNLWLIGLKGDRIKVFTTSIKELHYISSLFQDLAMKDVNGMVEL